MAEENEKKIDETVPGGKYTVGGVEVDAEGKPLGTAKEEEAPKGKKEK